MAGLTAYLDGRRIGRFEQSGRTFSLTYDADYAGLPVLSVSLTPTIRTHQGPAVENFLWGLLPDNPQVLSRWAREFGTTASSPLNLLAFTGMDCAGALQLTDATDGETLVGLTGDLTPLTESDIAQRISGLIADPTAWFGPSDDGRFSLAGAQAKFALRRTDAGWAVPHGTEASSHIFKPGLAGFAHGEVNEFLCLSAARSLGLSVPLATLAEFGDASVLIVERFDRRVDGAHLRRVHQEDMCQAGGVAPTSKYQSDGGPGLGDVAAMIRRHVTAESTRATQSFLMATAFNWLIVGSDAHAKNYSLLHDGPRTTLAPFYDLVSSLPYPDQLHPRKVRFAMSFDKHYRAFEVQARHVLSEFQQTGVPLEPVIHWIREMFAAAPDAVAAAASEVPKGQASMFAADLVARIATRAAVLRTDLDHAVAALPSSPRPRTRQVPRRI